MHNQTDWAKNILTWGIVLAGLGVIVTTAGFLLPVLVGGIFAAGKLIPAIGLFLFVLGVAGMAQYAYVRSNPKAGRQMMIHERDERMQLIRARAGNRAFWISSALAYTLLIWESFASSVGLPALTGDTLWFALAIVVIAPFIVYIGWIIHGQNSN